MIPRFRLDLLGAVVLVVIPQLLPFKVGLLCSMVLTWAEKPLKRTARPPAVSPDQPGTYQARIRSALPLWRSVCPDAEVLNQLESGVAPCFHRKPAPYAFYSPQLTDPQVHAWQLVER